MSRKLKTYVTSIGFFDQAIAAPSMKAALEAWGAGKNSFHHGFAEETDDPVTAAATMAKPGVVLKRAVGSNDLFTENPGLPKSLPAGKAPEKSKSKPKSQVAKKGKPADVVNLFDARAAKQAAVAYEKEKGRREKEEAQEEATRAKEQERRDIAMSRAGAVLERAQKGHDKTIAKFTHERDALDRREEEEITRWAKDKKKLEAAIRRARDDAIRDSGNRYGEPGVQEAQSKGMRHTKRRERRS